MTNRKICDILYLTGLYALKSTINSFRKIQKNGVKIMTFRELKEKQTAFYTDLQEQERAVNTIKAYRADLHAFFEWAADKDGQEITKSDVIEYKRFMQTEEIKVIKNGKEITKKHPVSTINRKIITINKYLKWAGAVEAAGTKQLKTQGRTLNNVMSRADYERMIRAAENPPEQARKAGLKPDIQISVIMQTIAATGIRFNELQYFTVENLREAKKTKEIIVYNKGKQRTISMDKDLIKLLTAYCDDRNITAGYIFVTKYGNPISNEQVSRRLKRIAGYARVNKDKIHPHAFRHLFAKEYMELHGRIDELQDLLGHANINTTTIYTKTTAKEKAAHVHSMGMIQTKPKSRSRSAGKRGKKQ